MKLRSFGRDQVAHYQMILNWAVECQSATRIAAMVMCAGRNPLLLIDGDLMDALRQSPTSTYRG
jgi:hypothetical protein